MNEQAGYTTKRRYAVWKPRLLTMGLSGASIFMAWLFWDAGSSQQGLSDQGREVKPSIGLTTAAVSVPVATNAGPPRPPVSEQSLASTERAKLESSSALVANRKDSPDIDLATQARLALQSGSAESAFKAAADIRSCDGIDGVVALAYKLPLENKPAHQIALKTILEDQRRCQALDEAAKALYEPLLLKAFEGGSRNAARSMATKPHLLATFSPEQKARVVQAVKTDAAQGDLTAISSLSNASARLGTSLQDDYAYALAFKSIRQEEGKDSKYFGAFPKEYFLAWDDELKYKEQQLSKAELEQARQQAEAVLRSYRESRLKNQNHNPKQP